MLYNIIGIIYIIVAIYEALFILNNGYVLKEC
jgi:hypothetical protein